MSLSGISETNWSRLTRGLTFLTEFKGHRKLTLMKEKSFQVDEENLPMEIRLIKLAMLFIHN